MSDERCRITVVGSRRQVDLAVPAGAPIAEYAGSLARLCAEEENEVMPAGWSLAGALGATFAPERSLAELGVADGAVLYLRDLIADEYDELLVLDIAEQVAETSGRLLDRPWTARARASAFFGAGLAWLIAMMLVLLLRHGMAGALLGAVAAGAGAALPLTAWLAGERRWALPAPARLVLALSAVPLFALAAWSIAVARFAGRMDHPNAVMTALGLEVAAALVGALAGAVLAAAATASVSTYAVLAAATVAAVAGAGLAALKADPIKCAAVVSLLGFALLLLAPALAGRIAALAFRHTTGPVGEGSEGESAEPSGSAAVPAAADGKRSGNVEDAVRRGMILLAAWGGGVSLLLAPCLAALAASHSPYAAALAGCLGLALLLHAGSAKVSVEVVPVALAGAVGLFTLVAVGPSRMGWPDSASAVVGLLIGLGLLGFGLRRLLRPELPGLARPGWFAPAAAVLAAAGLPLVLALFGVFGHLVGMGRNL